MTERISYVQGVAAVAILAIVATLLPTINIANAASTGLVTKGDITSLTTAVDVSANFGITAVTDEAGSTESTRIFLSDNSTTGTFFSGSFSNGSCSTTGGAAEKDFAIGINKGVCYSNSVAGTYEITVDLRLDDVVIGTPLTLAVTVGAAEEEAPAQDQVLLDLIVELTTQINSLQTQTGNTDTVVSPDASDTDEDLQTLIAALQEQIVVLQAVIDTEAEESQTQDPELLAQIDVLENQILTFELDADDISVNVPNFVVTFELTNEELAAGLIVLQEQIDGLQSIVDEEDVVIVVDEEVVPVDDSTSNPTDTTTDAVVDQCEFEGHKYDNEGNPLEGWEMGLMKIITHDNGVDVYDIYNDVTDADGFYCLRWSEERTIRGVSTFLGGPYSFIYRVYETNQADWEFVSSEYGADYTNLAVATEDLIARSDNQVQVQVGEENGFVIADAEFHVDFYNEFVGETEIEIPTTTDVFTELEMTSVCRVDGGGMTFSVENTNSTDITVTYTVDGTDDTGEVVIAPTTDTVFTTGTSTEFGTTTLTYVHDAIDYTLAVGAVSTDCVTESTNVSNPGSNGGSNGSTPSATRVGDRPVSGSATPTVAGISDSVSPAPLVLGDQVSPVPFGGANTGGGGTAAAAPSAVAMLLLAGLAIALQTRRLLNV